MGVWLNTRGLSSLAIAICDRCKFKMSITKLSSDPNFPGLKVCKDCLDVLDPWRLPARQTEDIHLPFTRPDRPLGLTPAEAAYPEPPVNGGGYLPDYPPTPSKG